MKNPEIHHPPEIPNELDIIQVDGRWGQSRARGGVITWLDTNQSEQIDLSEYELTKRYTFAHTVYDLKNRGEITMTDQEIRNIHWGAPQNGVEPSYFQRMEVKIFGIYTRKK